MHSEQPSQQAMSRNTNATRIALLSFWVACVAILSSGCCLLFKQKACNTPTSETKPPTATLTNTFWALTWVDGHDLGEPRPEREMHLFLDPFSDKLRGFGGCNEFFGHYDSSGTALHFSGLGATKMHCQGFMQTETALMNALEQTTTWKLAGDTLEFYDSQETMIAKFESRYFH
jgi:putative lipoprotein